MLQVPTISVCIFVYDDVSLLERSIESVLGQSFADFELLIVGCGAIIDNIVEKTNAYDDARVRIVDKQSDCAYSSYSMLSKARGKYIVRINVGETMCENRLRIQFDYMEQHPEIELLASGFTTFLNNDITHQTPQNIKTGRIALSDMIEGCCVCRSTIMFRKVSLCALELTDLQGLAQEVADYRLLIELLTKGKAIYIVPDVLTQCCVSDGDKSPFSQTLQSTEFVKVRHYAMQALMQKTAEAFSKPELVAETSNMLTVIIPFFNEKEEVRNTVVSVCQTAGDRVNIIVVNDASDDGYDYWSELKDLNVTYVVNNYRIGAALSKNRGVALCKTPFFMLLDAHMRFYQTDWVDIVVKELTANPQRLLCCQSLRLSKDENGNVVADDVPFNTKGAYLGFDETKYVPSVTWNNFLGDFPLCDSNQIACVLGAGYASSKKYWNKLRGLDGLIHYGCEEAYLSLKAWLEGGGCYLLPNIPAGHIYRGALPYKTFSIEVFYNNLIVSELLFPFSEKHFARAVAWQQSKDTYLGIVELLKVNAQRNNQLRQYYKETFKARSFEAYVALNSFCENRTLQQRPYSDSELEEKFDFIKAHLNALRGIGVYEGLAGALIATLYIEQAKHSEIHEDIVFRLWERLAKELLVTDCGYSFRNGYAGFGWALLYALGNELIEDDISTELCLVDAKIAEVSIKRIKDLSFETGVGGVYCYVVSRIRQCQGEKRMFAADFIAELQHEALRIIKETADWRTFNFVGQFLDIANLDSEPFVPKFREVYSLPKYLPDTRDKWELSLASVTGMIISKTSNNHKTQ